MIIKEEKRHTVARNKDSRDEIVAFIAQTSDKTSLFCIVCTKTSHIATDCHQVVGYLDW